MDGVRKAEGGGEGAGEIAWVPFGVGRSADGLHAHRGPYGRLRELSTRDGEEYARGLSRPGWRESAGIFGCPVGGSVATRCRQAGSGMARSRAKAG